MAISGFFKIEFKALHMGVGGLVTIEDGKVRGGDGQFLFSGTFESSGSAANASIAVRSTTPGAPSIFGNTAGGFKLDLTGTVSDTSFAFTGPAPNGGVPITIRGSKIGELDLS